jgi:hypothetical protein
MGGQHQRTGAADAVSAAGDDGGFSSEIEQRVRVRWSPSGEEAPGQAGHALIRLGGARPGPVAGAESHRAGAGGNPG